MFKWFRRRRKKQPAPPPPPEEEKVRLLVIDPHARLQHITFIDGTRYLVKRVGP